MKKKRLDQLVFERGLTESREKAKRLIIAGQISYKSEILTKPGLLLSEDVVLNIKEPEKYVSRGGNKLEGFLKEINLDVGGKKCLDIGASTGGFTDCLLQAEATKVVCVDVGSGILHWKLRNDKRVVVIEKTNARYLEKINIDKDFDIIVVDVSFISLKLIIPQIIPLILYEGSIICLVKPQFEAGRKFVSKGGVVKSEEIQLKCVEDIINFTKKLGFSCQKYLASCIKGPSGNQEYFVWFKKNES